MPDGVNDGVCSWEKEGKDSLRQDEVAPQYASSD